jgi:glucosamine--fructose-6-phosphate aminotransferase (isomerizing)
VPILAVVPLGAPAAGLVELLGRLRDRGGDIVVVSDSPAFRAVAGRSIDLPEGVPEWLRPVVSIVPAQLYAYHLTRARGIDPEAPRALRKVTLTR